ncbi:hypothetical protein QO206_15715 [Leeuwenhoekiella aequorea]|jgi:hypothetical protein|uniref:hypothetical protein n=1 Tax=Leeuwenhoekiella aequorea TaxID=283736 RepID=UPI000C8EB6A4|nr:hypothetical protein [Aequorivita sp.]MAL59810.1 hypothetical protein [Flavobacteriaceae bacterium]HAT65507.1 hypothetical protein [Flavobacteriaceae bacterium]|tara:strand:+ start:161 stop:427 length:267 start_codon:yes stop_codon:yes gene_type:complete
MNKKNIFITILIGFAIGVFILQPLGITIFTFSSQNYEINWGQYLINNFIEIVNINGNQIFENILFGLLGASVALMYYFGKREKDIDNK